MRVGFIGAGKVGTAIGRLLKDRNYQIAGYLSRSKISSERAAAITGSNSYTEKDVLAGDAGLLFITTPDSVIEDIAVELAELKCVGPGHTVVHMSGSLSSAVLKPVRDLGASVLSLHPLQSCASFERALENLPGSVFSLEGDETAMELGREIVEALGGTYFILNTEDKVLYHAAACMASNYFVTLFYLSEKILETSGVYKEMSVPALMPLIEGTAANLKDLPPSEALTGPIARGDIKTVEDHLKALETKLPEVLEIYKQLGLKTVELAEIKKTLNEETIDKLRAVLAK